jgi:hypothetical protein
MPLIIPANTLTGGYEVANSCRFNDGDSPSMSKSISSTSASWTFSAWVKRGSNLGTANYLVSWGDSGTDATGIGFDSGNNFFYYSEDSPDNILIETTEVYKDCSAWYHLVCKCNSGTITLYVNGASAATGSGGNALDSSTLAIGKWVTAAYYHDGYMAEVVFIDGTAYSASDFGEFDDDSPTIWKPKDVSGLTFGTHGFYLDFEASGNLGNDANGGTDLSESNLAATDQATDTPTNNFCTMDPLDNYYAASTFSEGNCKIVTASSPYSSNKGTFPLSKGKWYFEVEYDARSGSEDLFHLGISSTQDTANNQGLGYHPNDWGRSTFSNRAYGYFNNNSWTNFGTASTPNAIIGCYVDLDNLKLYWAVDGTVENSGTGIDITAVASTPFGFYLPALSWQDGSTTGTLLCNFGGCSAFTVSSGNTDANGYGNFEFDPSAGTFDSASKDFLAICSKNLAEYGG